MRYADVIPRAALAFWTTIAPVSTVRRKSYGGPFAKPQAAFGFVDGVESRSREAPRTQCLGVWKFGAGGGRSCSPPKHHFSRLASLCVLKTVPCIFAMLEKRFPAFSRCWKSCSRLGAARIDVAILALLAISWCAGLFVLCRWGCSSSFSLCLESLTCSSSPIWSLTVWALRWSTLAYSHFCSDKQDEHRNDTPGTASQPPLLIFGVVGAVVRNLSCLQH